jgi:hypothetical protein
MHVTRCRPIGRALAGASFATLSYNEGAPPASFTSGHPVSDTPAAQIELRYARQVAQG